MDTPTQREVNEAAYRQFKDTIAKTYPHGRFVAIAGGQVVADAETIRKLEAVLHERGYVSPDVLVVEAGVDYSKFMWILAILLMLGPAVVLPLAMWLLFFHSISDR
jgi:hypothetical protein